MKEDMEGNMLYKAMPTVPIKDLQARQEELLATIRQTPIMLTNQGEGAGILVYPQVWNELIEKLEHYQQLISSLQLEESFLLQEQTAAIEEGAGLWGDERYPEFKTSEDMNRWLKNLRGSTRVETAPINGTDNHLFHFNER